METIETGVMVFRCELLRSKLPLSQCIANWRRSNEPPERPRPGGFTKIPLSECKDCPLGHEHVTTGKFRSGLRTEALQTQAQKPVIKTPVPMPRQEVIHVPIESMRRPEPVKRAEVVERPVVVERPEPPARPREIVLSPDPTQENSMEDLEQIHETETKKRRLADVIRAMYDLDNRDEQSRVDLRRAIHDFTKVGTVKELSDRIRVFERTLVADLNFQTYEERQDAAARVWGTNPLVIRAREIVAKARAESQESGSAIRYGDELREIVTDLEPLFPTRTALASLIDVSQSMIGTWIHSVQRKRAKEKARKVLDEALGKQEEPSLSPQLPPDPMPITKPELRFEDYAPKTMEVPKPEPSFSELMGQALEKGEFGQELTSRLTEQDEKLKRLGEAIVSGMRSTDPLPEKGVLFDGDAPVFSERHEGSQRQDLAALIERGDVRILPPGYEPPTEEQRAATPQDAGADPASPPKEHPAVTFGREAFLPYMPGRVAPGSAPGVAWVTHSFRLRKDLVVHIQLPEDLTAGEAARIQTFVGLLVF